MSSSEQVDAAVKGTPWPIRRHGNGATVLVLHGSTGAAAWAGTQEALSHTNTVLLPTHPGFDGTTRPDWLDRISDLANAYLELIDTQGWGRVHVVGHELGGWIAAEMAVRQPDTLASLSLISTQGLPVAADAVGIDTFLLTDEQRWLDSIHDPALARDLAAQPRDEAEAIAAIRNLEMAARLTWQPRGYDLDLAKWLHRLKMPVQVVWGANDRILPPAHAQAWAEQLPHARVELIDACGHLPQLEQPARLNDCLAQFIAQARSAA